MKNKFYLKLAWTGIKKNHQIYTPYIFTCIGMVMMYYIVAFLAQSSVLEYLHGKESLESLLSMGSYVIGFFALFFLLYSHSFLLRRRKMEFGLYNILGMEKRNLIYVLIWESIGIMAVSLTIGLICGIVFSKIAELIMLNVIQENINFSLSIGISVIGKSVLLFAGIFLIIFLNSVRQIRISNPIELLRSSNLGDKKPKANWVLAILGIVLLGVAYYIALSIEEPFAAIMAFVGVVILVIVATYLLFIAGSVALCRLLQKNKSYYYQTNHFVSLSSMIYRMKRNGAGLATICILSTMILVMLSTTVCMCVGLEDGVRKRYNRDVIWNIYSSDTQVIQSVQDQIQEVLEESHYTQNDAFEYRMLELIGFLNGNQFNPDPNNTNELTELSDFRDVYFVSLEDYNRVMDKNEQLAADEVLFYSTGTKYAEKSIEIQGYQSFKVKKSIDKFDESEASEQQLFDMIILVVSDFESVNAYFEGKKDSSGENLADAIYHFGFDVDASKEEQLQLYDTLSNRFDILKNQKDFPELILEVRENERSELYAIYGGLLFFGIFLSLVFVLAMVLIIYYKQVAEGYEDKDRFKIMQKIGMTKKEIQKTINSQILTVFFLPLIVAGVHLAVAFPILSKIMLLFNVTNYIILITTIVGCYLVFGIFYIIIYKVTSSVYYKIVSRNFA
jgi:putative ABC transport system permease protein